MSSVLTVGVPSKGEMGEISPLPEPEIIVQQVIEREKSGEPDSFWESREKIYLYCENFLREHKDKVPTIGNLGPLHYGMSPTEMEGVIEKKFQEMASSGKIITERDLTKHDRTTFHPHGTDLTRIWGAAFLKSNLSKDSKLNAADFYLIVDDDASEIEVEVWNDPNNPVPVVGRIQNAQILSKRIDGTRSAWAYQHNEELKRLHYLDFKDPGNIICDSNGIGWVVDTETKSFDSPFRFLRSWKWGTYMRYLSERFKVLYGDEKSRHTIKIPVSDIGLKK